jgi:hypothetical protein
MQPSEKPLPENLDVLSPFTVVEVTTEQQFNSFIACLKKVFTDPTDIESDERFAHLFHNPALASFYGLIDSDGNTIGVQLIRISPHVPDAMYIPYGGLVAEHRGTSLYSRMARYTAARMLKRGVKYSLNDVEDPGRIEGVYPDENQDEVIRRCQRRIDFFKRSLGMHFVNDESVSYCRPASNDPRQIQAYDLLGIRPLDENDPFWRTIFNDNKTAIRKEAYEQAYLSLMQIEYGDESSAPSLADLCSEYPAIALFFETVGRCHNQWITLDKS